MNYLVYLHSIWISHKRFFVIFKSNKNYKEFFENISTKNLSKYWFNSSQIEKIILAKKTLNTQKIDKILLDLEVKIILFWDKNYPKNLENISNPPYFLYVRGKIDGLDNFFAIVWSRKMTSYTKKVWEYIIPDLTKYFTIVSWWAWWCDSLAHEICVKNSSKTIVVFWTWIDIVYPSTNKKLFENVLKNSWALISIFPIWTLWSVYSFPIRNEIVAWLSNWVLILEASLKSGTLITANLALEQWKDLFAIPWDIFQENFSWTNTLIKNSNAKLVSNSQDILDEYNYKVIQNKKEFLFENEIQKEIFNILKFNLSLNIDEIMQKLNYDYSEISINLSMMELSGNIKKDLFWKYEIAFV